ncbi:hypothetical protein ACJX0J_005751, partial [Zea mays]
MNHVGILGHIAMKETLASVRFIYYTPHISSIIRMHNLLIDLQDQDWVHAANGIGMKINHVGGLSIFSLMYKDNTVFFAYIPYCVDPFRIRLEIPAAVWKSYSHTGDDVNIYRLITRELCAYGAHIIKYLFTRVTFFFFLVAQYVFDAALLFTQQRARTRGHILQLTGGKEDEQMYP